MGLWALLEFIIERIQVCDNHHFAFYRIFAIILFIHACMLSRALILHWTISKATQSNKGIRGLIELRMKIKGMNKTKNAKLNFLP